MSKPREEISESIYGLIGDGGFGREVMPVLSNQLRRESGSEHSCLFVNTEPKSKSTNGYPVVSEVDFLAKTKSVRFFNIAIGNSRIREAIAKRFIQAGAKSLAIRAESAVMYDANEIGEGLILCAHTTVTSNAKIGRFVHMNIYSYVAHDCVIGDFVTFAPGVKCNGNVHVGAHAYLGTGAIIKQGTYDCPRRIGEGAIVGMGAVVTKDVAPNTVVVGNPAKVLQR